MASLRQQIIFAIDVAVSSGARISKACEAIHLNERRLRRWRKTEHDGRLGGYHAKEQRLSEREKDDIVSAFQKPGMDDMPIKAAHATLLDQGLYLGSPSTIARVLRERKVRKPKVGRNGNVKRPELVATKPRQVWCWDITWLDSHIKGKYYYLYMVIDMYSRKVVAWVVHTREDGALARAMFAEAFAAEGIVAGETVVHSDNGTSMRSRTLRSLFDLLSVIASYGRPHTSNDNAFAESLFATLKGRISFPEYFSSIEAANAFCLEFFTWYNCFHLHSGLDFVTPQTVHAGQQVQVFEKRNVLLEENRRRHPSRHGGMKKKFGLPSEVRLKHRTMMTEMN